jgi:regulatory protein
MTAEVSRDGELDPPGDPESVARTICLAQLDRRARTRSELATILRRRGVPGDAARSVLDRFTDLGLIDDAALAADLAITQHHERGLAGPAVAMKLRQRGIDEPVVQAAVAEIDAEGVSAAARLLVARRLRSLRGLESHVQVRRLLGLLARRGYPHGLAHQIVRESLADAGIAEFNAVDD